jgi:LEA14-like dessication related protein
MLPVAVLLLSVTGVLVSGCATPGPALRTPDVRLESIALDNLGFDRQTFLLGFSVSNPNPFPLPVRSVSYEVLLDDHRFASGATSSDFSIAAMGNGNFAISVEVDLMQSAPKFTALLKSGFDQIVTYQLRGSFGVDIPLVQPVAFVHSGTVQLGDAGF